MVYLPVKFWHRSVYFPWRYSTHNPDTCFITHYGVCIFPGTFLCYKRSIRVRETQSHAIQRQTSDWHYLYECGKLGNVINIQTQRRKKRLCPPQSCVIQRQTSEVGALQYETIYELTEQRIKQWQGVDVGSVLYSTQGTVLDSTRGNLDTLQGVSKTGKDNRELTALRVVSYVVMECVLCNRSAEVCSFRD